MEGREEKVRRRDFRNKIQNLVSTKYFHENNVGAKQQRLPYIERHESETKFSLKTFFFILLPECNKQSTRRT